MQSPRSFSWEAEELHLVVQAQTGKDSLKELTEPERRRVAYVLGQMKESASGKRKRPVGMTGNATDNQRRKIYMLTKELGWDDNPKRLSGFIRRMFKVERVEWLNYEQCSNLIEALKKMIERQEAAAVNDFRVTIRAKNGKIGIDAEGEVIVLEDLATTCGIMQILAGEMALKQGRSLDDVKDAMLDIHLAAMQKLMDDQAERELWDE